MVRFAFRNLLTRPLRSLLALVGLTVAIAGMVGLYSVAGGIQDMVQSTFGKIPGLVVMQQGAPIPLFSRLPAAWGDEIAKLKGVHVVHPEVWARAHMIDGSPTISPPRFLFGVDIPSCLKLRQGVYEKAMQQGGKGRFFQLSDQGTLNIVISDTVANEFGRNVGDTLRIDGRTFTIVGIFHTGSLLLDVSILVDQEIVRDLGRINRDTACAFYVEPETESDRGRLKKEIGDLFRGREIPAFDAADAIDTELESLATNPLARLLLTLVRWVGGPTRKPPPKPATSGSDELALEIRDSEDWARQFGKFSEDLDLFLGIMTTIGVVIAVLGILNTMLMSVTERFIEFGILKANGWSSRHVLVLIGCESLLLGLAGGVLGAFFGWLATLVINGYFPDRVHLYASPQLLVFALFFSMAVGVLSGLYPAIWASRMMPMDAIRRG